ncbi:MAG: AsmA-like C-terminal region-containing protein, partial [Chromatiaceae bacterium]|nr:AsmA-like C-terminal region-containing protein [Chromatiaceae bacterium]
SAQLTGHLLPRSLELDSNADFYGGRLETQFAASQLAGASVPQPGREPDSASTADKASSRPEARPGPGPGPGRAFDAQSAGARAPGSDLQLEATASGVDLAALLSELQLGGHDQVPITGLAEIDLDLFARGADSASILSTLGGEAAFAVREGAVTMVDLGQLITGTIGAIGVSREDAENLTRFHVLTLSAKGAEGRFSSDDIQLRSNLLNIDGRGELDLTTQQIALNLQAVMTKPPKGQGRGIKELEGIPIPISASGPWADPRWEVDVRSALDTAARRALREDNGLFDEIEERTGIKGLGDGLRQILPGLLGR